MSLIAEFKPRRGIWVLIPTIIFFARDSDGPYTDITLAWFCFGITLRIGENKQ
jgi:hypothetical protein